MSSTYTHNHKSEGQPLIFSAYPTRFGSLSFSFISRSFLHRFSTNLSSNLSPIRLVLLFSPIIILYILYAYATAGPFLPTSCQLTSFGCPAVSVHGYVRPEFENVKRIFMDNFKNGDDIGAGVTIYFKGEKVVDLLGGIRNLDSQQKYDEDTLQLVFSSSKVMTSLVVSRLVERNILSYNTTISTYWPEFGQGNKENVTLGDLMTHRAGVSFISHHRMTIKDIYDLDHLAQILAAEPHNFDGVRTRAYHAVTRGWYVNEIVRRVDEKNRTVGEIFQEEIANEYGIDFYYKLSEEMEERVATIYEYPMLRVLAKLLLPDWAVSMFGTPLHKIFGDMLSGNSVTFKTLVHTAPDQTQPAAYNRREMHIAEGPSYSGMTNARSMAKIAAMFANRGQPLPNSNEKPLVSIDTYNILTQRLPEEYDVVLHENMVATAGGLGYFRLEGLEDVEFIGWGGSGGSMFIWNE
ncbi:3495_t:CDS:2, partial [Paraglomus occultum]